MKILFCTCRNPNFITITEYIENAIMALGHEVIFFDDRQFILPGRLREKLPFLSLLELTRINKRLVKVVKELKPDLCLMAGGNRVLPAAVRQIKGLNIKTVLWTIDAPVFFEPVIEAAPEYDFVFCGGSEAVEILKNHCSPHWLPFACDPDIHRPAELTPDDMERYGVDLVFVGSYYPNRLAAFEKLTGLKIAIWGPGWERAPASPALRPCLHSEQLKPEVWMKIFCAAKMVIVIHYQDGKIPCYQASPKLYEAMACGAFVLVDDQPDVFRLFKDTEHLVKFSSPDDLKIRAEYYLARPEERSRIAAEGQREVLARHTYRHRIAEMLAMISG